MPLAETNHGFNVSACHPSAGSVARGYVEAGMNLSNRDFLKGLRRYAAAASEHGEECMICSAPTSPDRHVMMRAVRRSAKLSGIQIPRLLACERCAREKGHRSGAELASARMASGLVRLDAIRDVLAPAGRPVRQAALAACPALKLLPGMARAGHGTSARRAKLAARDGGAACVWCSKRAAPDSFTFEHLIPRGAGGPNCLENLVLACPSCNHARGRAPAAAWAAQAAAAGRQPRWTVLSSRLDELAFRPPVHVPPPAAAKAAAQLARLPVPAASRQRADTLAA